MMLSTVQPEENISVESKSQEPLSTETNDDRAKELERRLAMLGVEDNTEEMTETEAQPEQTVDLLQPEEGVESPDLLQNAVEAPKTPEENLLLSTLSVKALEPKVEETAKSNKSALLVSTGKSHDPDDRGFIRR